MCQYQNINDFFEFQMKLFTRFCVLNFLRKLSQTWYHRLGVLEMMKMTFI